MSAEVPTPSPNTRRTRPSFLNSNRKQVILFVVLTLLLTVATVWTGRVLLQNSETLSFAVGEPNGPEARFAARLAAVLRATSSRLRDEIGLRRESLNRQSGHDHNVVVVKTAQSA